MTARPLVAGEWTVDDVDLLPDDGLQYELLDGVLLVILAPFDWRPDRHTSLQPDLMVVRTADAVGENVGSAMVLAVEVLSPSTRRKDQVWKRTRYEEGGVGSYWLLDRRACRPSTSSVAPMSPWRRSVVRRPRVSPCRSRSRSPRPSWSRHRPDRP